MMETQPIEIPEFQILRGKKAIKALYDFIKEVEEQRGKELTEKQTAALIKLARGLISSIEAETRSSPSDKDSKEMRFTALAYSPRLFSLRAASPAMLYLRGPFTTVPC
jgi:hypothetical protein